MSKNSTIRDAFYKVRKSGRFRNWMDYQKWYLSQVVPINKYNNEAESSKKTK